MTQQDLDKLLAQVPKNSDGGYRGIVSVQIEGKPVGPFKYFGTRGDDPNDVVPHEHRRELRGLDVFSAWLNHNDSRSINSLDTLVRGERYRLRSPLSDGLRLDAGKPQHIGRRQLASVENIIWTSSRPLNRSPHLDSAVPYWAHAHYPDILPLAALRPRRSGPTSGCPTIPNPSFLNRLPDDEFWAAKQVMAFTDEQIRAIVKVAQYSDPQTETYIADTTHCAPRQDRKSITCRQNASARSVRGRERRTCLPRSGAGARYGSQGPVSCDLVSIRQSEQSKSRRFRRPRTFTCPKMLPGLCIPILPRYLAGRRQGKDRHGISEDRRHRPKLSALTGTW